MSITYLRQLSIACAILFSLPVNAGDLVLGQVAPFSGPLAPTGTAFRHGIQLYVDATNAAGGIIGAKLKLVSKDDEYKTEKTVSATKELLNEANPVVLTGFVGTGNINAILKERLLEDAGIPLVGVRSGANNVLNSGNPWLFLTRAGYADEIAKIVELYVLTGTKRFAVLYQNDDFGQDGLKTLEKLSAEQKFEIVARGSYEKNTTDVASAVKAIATANPQTVIMISNTAASAEFVKQIRASGNVSQLVGLSVNDGQQMVSKIGADTAKGVAFSQVVPAPNQASVALIREIQDALKRFPQGDASISHTMIEGYLTGKIIGEALKKAGNNPSRKQLRDALKATNKDFGGLTVNFTGKSQAGLKFVDLTILNKEGKLLR